jgi:hypothetical protein
MGASTFQNAPIGGGVPSLQFNRMLSSGGKGEMSMSFTSNNNRSQIGRVSSSIIPSQRSGFAAQNKAVGLSHFGIT